jgi:hypothetical protein
LTDHAHHVISSCAGVTVSVFHARSLLIFLLIEDGHQDKLSPHLLDAFGEQQSHKFCCTPYWVRAYFRKVLRMSWRVATKAAQKLPADWEVQGKDMLQRIAIVSMVYKVPPELVILMDETFFNLHPDSRCGLSI